MELTVSFDGNKKLTCRFEGHSVATDQPVKDGGEGGAPSPSDYFLASLATCGAYYVLGFCTRRDIPLDGVGFSLDAVFDPDAKLYGRMEYRITLPPGFPAKYRKPLARAVDQCFVKKHFDHPPAFEVVVEERS